MVFGCTVAVANEFADTAVAGRLATDPLGSVRAPTAALASEAYQAGLQGRVPVGRLLSDYR